MGLFDKLFGSDDPLSNELEESLSEEEKEQDSGDDEELPYNVMLDEKEWPYQFEPRDSEKLAGREILVEDQEGDKWAGKYVRDLIENRRYDKKGPTRLGYAKDDVKGVQDVYIDHKALFKHMAMFGTTGYGKSTVMRNVMLQWLHSGYGLCFIDPKGADSGELIQQMPPHRLDDIVYVEPGGNREKMVGFNVFDTQAEPGDARYESEVTSVADDFRSILEDVTNYWGPRLDNITNTIITQLIRAEEPYNPVDMTKILTDPEEMDALVDNYGDDIEQTFLDRVSDLNQEDLDPLITRLQKWVGKRETRQMMAHEESNINISKIVQDGKILIVNTSNIQDQSAKMIITRTIISRIWSAIQTRSEIPDEEKEPFYLCIDEFDKVVNADFDINDIISMARSYKLGVYVTNQQPSQLPDGVKNSVQQVGSLLSFNPGNAHRDANDIAQAIGDVDAWQLGEINPYTLVGRPMMNGEKQDGMTINTFAEYPYLRDDDAAEKIIQKSLEKYGADPNISADMEDYGVTRYVQTEDEGVEINEQGDTVAEEQLLECVYAAQVRNETVEIDGLEDWIEMSDVKEEIEKYVGSIESTYGSKISNLFERFSERELKRSLKGERPYIRLGNEGLKRVFTQDTGAMASGGKSPHRILLREGHKAFTKLGCDVRLPTQEGARQPDGVAEIPINPMEESANFNQAVEKQEQLVRNNPRLMQLFGDNEISIEAESTTIKRPSQTIKNLAKALKIGNRCVFLVKDGTEKHDEFEYWARVGENILTDPPFVKGADDANNRTFYTTNQKVSLSNGGVPLVPTDVGNIKWHEKGKENTNHTADPGEEPIKLVLDTTDTTEPFAVFDDASQVIGRIGPDPSYFPYHYYRDSDTQKTIVKDDSGEIVERYENLDDMRSDNRFRPVLKPIIPEHALPQGKIPDPEMWTFVIIPDDSSVGPQIYEDGELEPLLLEDGATIQPSDFDLPVDIDVESVVDSEHIVKETPSESEIFEPEVEPEPSEKPDVTAETTDEFADFPSLAKEDTDNDSADPLSDGDESDQKQNNDEEDDVVALTDIAEESFPERPSDD